MPAASVESSTDQAFLVFPTSTTAANETAVAATPFDHYIEADSTAVIPSHGGLFFGGTAGHSLPGSLKEQSLVNQSVAQSLPSSTVAQSLSNSTAAHSLSGSTAAQSLSSNTVAQSLSSSTAAHSLPGGTAAHSLPGSTAAHSLPGSTDAHSLPGSTAAHNLPTIPPSDTDFNGQAGTQNDAVPLLLTQSVP
jgi:hypothetical protein